MVGSGMLPVVLRRRIQMFAMPEVDRIDDCFA